MTLTSEFPRPIRKAAGGYHDERLFTWERWHSVLSQISLTTATRIDVGRSVTSLQRGEKRTASCARGDARGIEARKGRDKPAQARFTRARPFTVSPKSVSTGTSQRVMRSRLLPIQRRASFKRRWGQMGLGRRRNFLMSQIKGLGRCDTFAILTSNSKSPEINGGYGGRPAASSLERRQPLYTPTRHSSPLLHRKKRRSSYLS